MRRATSEASGGADTRASGEAAFDMRWISFSVKGTFPKIVGDPGEGATPLAWLLTEPPRDYQSCDPKAALARATVLDVTGPPRRWLVEVRGVEPRSAEFFVSNSPSAATGWLSAGGITAAVSHRPIRNGAWPGGPGIPPGASRFSDALIRRGGNPPDRTGYLSIRQPAPFVVWHLFLFARLFCEVPETSARFRHGDYSTSNPSHPHVFSVPPNYINPLRHPPPGFGPGRG